LTRRVIIAGGRDFGDVTGAIKRGNANEIHTAKIQRLWAFYALDRLLLRMMPIEPISGRATGADTVGEQWAELRGMKSTPFPAKWRELGKAAGPIRNQEMADYAGSDGMLVAFWDGESNGTRGMVRIAKEKGMGVEVVRYPTLGMPVTLKAHTAPIRRSISALDPLIPVLDVTRKSGGERGHPFAPSWALLGPFLASRKAGNVLTDDDWERYSKAYTMEMRTSYRDNRAAWDALLLLPSVILTCYCGNHHRCHRTLLARDILPKLGAEYCGEVYPHDKNGEAETEPDAVVVNEGKALGSFAAPVRQGMLFGGSK
jgi:hypothetical protein